MHTLKTGLKFVVVMTVVLGVIYPLCVTGLLHLFAPTQATGSLVLSEGRIVGSRLIAQPMTSPRYFWPRPSACQYGLPSGASNLSPGAAQLYAQTSSKNRVWLAAGNAPSAEMTSSSGSGVDPEITPHGAFAQITRIAKARGLTLAQTKVLRDIVVQHTQSRTFGVWGHERVNVLELNLAVGERFGK